MTVLVFLQRNVDERDRLSADCVGASCLTIKSTHTLEGQRYRDKHVRIPERPKS